MKKAQEPDKDLLAAYYREKSLWMRLFNHHEGDYLIGYLENGHAILRPFCLQKRHTGTQDFLTILGFENISIPFTWLLQPPATGLYAPNEDGVKQREMLAFLKRSLAEYLRGQIPKDAQPLSRKIFRREGVYRHMDYVFKAEWVVEKNPWMRIRLIDYTGDDELPWRIFCEDAFARSVDLSTREGSCVDTGLPHLSRHLREILRRLLEIKK